MQFPDESTSAPARLRTRSLAAIFCFALSLLIASSASLAQNPPPGKPEEQPRRDAPPLNTETPRQQADDPVEDDVLRIDTDLVLLDVAVTDTAGRPVKNLRPQDFKIYEDGEERAVSFFNVARRGGAERPVAVVFAIDVSGSMTAGEMSRLGDAMQVFSKRLAERPAVFAVMSFGMNAKVIQSFTNDTRKLERAFERLARDLNGLSTHTYDAVDDAIRLLVRSAPRTRERRLMKRAVVVVTDGFPVGDTVSCATVIERANAADVSVYTVTLPSFTRLLASAADKRTPLPTPLDVSGLTEKTGGLNIYATSQDYESLFKALAEEVTSSYVLAFYPPEAKRRDGRYHTIRIEAPRGLVVRQSRPGYTAEGKK